MKDKTQTREQLIHALLKCRKRIANLEALEREHRQKEEELKKFKTISDRAGHGIVMRDLAGQFIYVNEAFAQMHGYTAEEIIGKHFSIVHTEEQVTHVDRLRSDPERIDGYISEVGHERRDGTVFPTLMTGSTIRDDNGRPLYFSATAIDITELKQAEEGLRKQTLRNELILQTAMDGFCILDMKGNILQANQAASMILGYTQEQLIGMNILDSEVQEAPGERSKHVKKVMKRGFHRFEARHRDRDGGVMDLEFSTNFVEMGKERFFFSFFRDITKRKQTEKALKEREEELETKNLNLEEANTALKVLLKRRDEDKKELEEKVLYNIKELIAPYLEKLNRSGLNERQNAYTSILKSNLNDIISPLSHRLSFKYLSLTPAEIQVANLIKQGKTTKEIAEVFSLSPDTIDAHRKNIRKKIGIRNSKVNLRTHLMTMQ